MFYSVEGFTVEVHKSGINSFIFYVFFSKCGSFPSGSYLKRKWIEGLCIVSLFTIYLD